MEVVVLEELGFAVFGDLGVDSPAAQFVLDGSEAGFGLVERGGYCGPAKFAVLAIFKAE